MNDKLKIVFKNNNVSSDMEKYILGDTKVYNAENYYYWGNLVLDAYKEINLDNEYMKRIIELLFKYESYDAHTIYFTLFEKTIESYKKAIEFLIENLKFQLSKAVYLYLKFEDSLSDNSELIKYFYEKDSSEVENIINHYEESNSHTESGGFNYYHEGNLLKYLLIVKDIASLDFNKIVKKKIYGIQYELMQFYFYLPFFSEEDKKEVTLNSISKFLDKISANQKTKDVILNFLETGEKNKNFEKSIKKISTHNQSYIHDDFSKFIKFREPKASYLYDQRLITISMQINKYKTIENLLFTIYTNNFLYKLDETNINKLVESWDAISYENIIDYLTYHIAVNYYGLNAEKLINIYLNEDFDKTINAIAKSSGKGVEAVLDILYKYDKEKTNKFIIDNITIFTGKKLIEKVIEILQMEKSNTKKLIKLINHKKSNVRQIIIMYLMQINDKNNHKLLKKAMNTEKSNKIKDMIIEHLIINNVL